MLNLPETAAGALTVDGSSAPAEGPNSSPYELLLQALNAHIAAEADALAAYRRLAETALDPVVRMLMGLILEDEERHHSLMGRIAARLRDDLQWGHSAEALPTGQAEQPSDQEMEALRTFIYGEQEGIRQLRRFADESAGIHDGLPSMLLEMMVTDSQKHEQILRFLYRRLGSTLNRAN